jgi:AAA+ ATPase superfamily predicted ATPase
VSNVHQLYEKDQSPSHSKFFFIENSGVNFSSLKKKKKQDHFFFLVFPFLPSSILWKANFIIDFPYQKQKALVIDVVKEFQTVLFVNCFASAAINNS